MKRGAVSMFTPEQQKDIKKRIWDGEIQRVIAKAVNLQPTTMKSIVAGYIWYDVPWPDGSTGPLSDEQRRSIALARNIATGKKTRHFGSAITMVYQDREAEAQDSATTSAIAILKHKGNLNPTREEILEQKRINLERRRQT